jgi:antitoxin CptB
MNKRFALSQSRRGMKELDLLLMNFTRNLFDELTMNDQNLYLLLLKEEDQDLWRWLLNIDAPVNQDYQDIIRLIQNSYQSN